MLADVLVPAAQGGVGAAGREAPVEARGRGTVIARRERRAATWAHELDALMARRPDLMGVNPAADLAVEAVRWSV